MSEISQNWKIAQSEIAQFLQEKQFKVKEEIRLKNGKRIDILALYKIKNVVYHIIIEVKDWQTVSRKNEFDFCAQLISYIIEYALEVKLNNKKDHWGLTEYSSRDYFIGILCLTKNSHFSYRIISPHFVKKNKDILGIPLREQISENIKLYVARVDYLHKVFNELKLPLYKEGDISTWINQPKKD